MGRSGRERQGAQSSQSAAELVSPGPALWQMLGGVRRCRSSSSHRRPYYLPMRNLPVPQSTQVVLRAERRFFMATRSTGPLLVLALHLRVDSGRGQNRTLTPLATLWPPVFAGELDIGLPKE